MLMTADVANARRMNDAGLTYLEGVEGMPIDEVE